MAEWRHGLLVVLPYSLAEALSYSTGCRNVDREYRRLCLEEAAVELLALAVEERNPAWREEGVRALALLEIAARYLGWLRAGGWDEETGWELLRRAYNVAAAAYFATKGALRGGRQLRRALEAVRKALETRRGLLEAAIMLSDAVAEACPTRLCGASSLRGLEAPARRGRAYAPEALAHPP